MAVQIDNKRQVASVIKGKIVLYLHDTASPGCMAERCTDLPECRFQIAGGYWLVKKTFFILVIWLCNDEDTLDDIVKKLSRAFEFASLWNSVMIRCQNA